MKKRDDSAFALIGLFVALYGALCLVISILPQDTSDAVSRFCLLVTNPIGVLYSWLFGAPSMVVLLIWPVLMLAVGVSLILYSEE